jgi:hypothetical protein
MDTLRGPFDSGEPADRGWDASDDESPETYGHRELPPEAIGQDERRMQVRAYNHWAGLLGDRMFPSIDDLDPANLHDFGPYSVLLDFTAGIENPAVQFLGAKLAQECGGNGVITHLSDVPPRSLLSRITDHYMQILANQAPIGFEAEFVNLHGVEILYRGILLPYSSNDETIDFIYGVINWKEMADQLMADELLLEIDQALELGADLELAEEPAVRAADPVTDWADSPAHEGSAEFGDGFSGIAPYDLSHAEEEDEENEAEEGLSFADFANLGFDDEEEYDEDEGEEESGSYSFASLASYIEAPAKKAIDPAELPYDPDADVDYEMAYDPAYDAGYEAPLEAPFAPEPAVAEDEVEDEDEDALTAEAAEDEVEETEEAEAAETILEDVYETEGDDVFEDEDFPVSEMPEEAGLYDWLAAARELAHAVGATEDRSRSALYAAVSRAYDFSLAAQAAPEDYAELLADSGLTVQERAPMTPVVKLVFGHDYDKTRLTEYAAVLSHAHRLELEQGSLADFLGQTEGGLKAVVKAERRLRREEQGKPIEDASAVREALAEKLRELEAITLEALDGAGPEFALVLIRRDEVGCAELVAELPEDIAQLERAARKLVG